MTIFPLGDSAITIDLGNLIDEGINRQALAIAEWLKNNTLPGITDIVTAYSAVTVLYDPFIVRKNHGNCPDGAFACMQQLLTKAWSAVGTPSPSNPALSAPVKIPVCYDAAFAPDLRELADAKNISCEELIKLHLARVYKVYMIGFLPGFPYMGTLDPILASPRKQKPVPVLAGGVGIAGNQTGVYPVDSPGGWQIIGRTPLRLFDRHEDNPVRLKPGDLVQFYPVSPDEFRAIGSVPASMSFEAISDRCRG